MCRIVAKFIKEGDLKVLMRKLKSVKCFIYYLNNVANWLLCSYKNKLQLTAWLGLYIRKSLVNGFFLKHILLCILKRMYMEMPFTGVK